MSMYNTDEVRPLVYPQALIVDYSNGSVYHRIRACVFQDGVS